MKNKTSSLLLIAITLLTRSLSGVTVFLDNNYGAKLNFKISPLQPEGQYIGHNVRVKLGDVNTIPELSIRTTGMGSNYVSYYHSLNYFLTDIKNQQARHSNDDAIITVDPSGYMSNWNVTLTWEPKGKNIKPFEYADFPTTIIGVPKVNPSPSDPFTRPAVTMDIDQLEQELELIELPTAEERLNRIKNGALGPNYAQKTVEICNADYTQAKKLGKIDLCSRLKTELLAPKFGIAEKRIKAQIAEAKRQRKKVVVVPSNLASAIDDIKNSINRMHNALAGYKARGEAQ